MLNVATNVHKIVFTFIDRLLGENLIIDRGGHGIDLVLKYSGFGNRWNQTALNIK